MATAVVVVAVAVMMMVMIKEICSQLSRQFQAMMLGYAHTIHSIHLIYIFCRFITTTSATVFYTVHKAMGFGIAQHDNEPNKRKNGAKSTRKYTRNIYVYKFNKITNDHFVWMRIFVVFIRTHIIRSNTERLNHVCQCFLCARCTSAREKERLCRWLWAWLLLLLLQRNISINYWTRCGGLVAFASVLLMFCRSKIITMSIFKSVVTKQWVCAHRLMQFHGSLSVWFWKQRNWICPPWSRFKWWIKQISRNIFVPSNYF